MPRAAGYLGYGGEHALSQQPVLTPRFRGLSLRGVMCKEIFYAPDIRAYQRPILYYTVQVGGDDCFTIALKPWRGAGQENMLPHGSLVPITGLPVLCRLCAPSGEATQVSPLGGVV
jgi:hypothetical protein